MKTLPPFRRLSVEETAALAARARAGDTAARNRLIEANMRLVAKLATKAATKAGAPHLLDELIQAAVAGSGTTKTAGGLMRAIETFDPSRARFSTHATHWIKAEIYRVLYSQNPTCTHTVAKRLGDATPERVHVDENELVDPTDPEQQLLERIHGDRIHEIARRVCTGAELLVLQMRVGLVGREVGLTAAEIAAELGISQTKTLNLFRAACVKVREEWDWLTDGSEDPL